MSTFIESQVFSGELYIKASDHHRAVEHYRFEVEVYRKRHDALLEMLAKNASMHANPPVTLMAEPESFNAGFNSGKAAAERQMMQLFTDPENQPTQHGTVTVEYMQREIAAEREAMVVEAAKKGWAMKNEEPFEDAVQEIAAIRARVKS